MVLEKSPWELMSGRHFQFVRPTFTLWINPTHLGGDGSTSDECEWTAPGNLKSNSLQLLSVKNKR